MEIEEIQCPMCKNIYDENDHLPILLPDCGHSYCVSCINAKFEKIKENGGEEFFVCPEDE